MNHHRRKLERDIEQSVLERKTTQAQALLNRYRKKYQSVEETEFFYESLRRLGLHLLGLKYLKQDWKLGRRSNQVLLWTARFLNSVGASSLALRALSQVKETSLETLTSETCRIYGGIFLVNGKYPDAAKYYEAALRGTTPESAPRPLKLTWIALADALSGMGNTVRARAIAQAVVGSAPDSLLKGIGLSALGEYFASEKDWTQAYSVLAEADETLPKDQSVDRAFLHKWLGLTLCQLKDRAHDKKRGVALLQDSLLFLKNVSVREEAWLKIYELLMSVDAGDPALKARLSFFPGFDHDHTSELSSHLFGDRESARFHIDLARNEYQVRVRQKVEHYFGIPREVRLLAWMRIASDWGLGSARCKSLLWGEEFYSYFELESRLQQLLRRIRKSYGVSVHQKGGVLSILPSHESRVSVFVSHQALKPSLLERTPGATARNIAEFYKIGKTQSFEVIRQWKEAGFFS